MPVYYADSSVLVKRHIREVGTLWFTTLVGLSTTLIVTAEFSITEVYSALNRRRRERSIGQRLYADAVNDFLETCHSEYELVALSGYIIESACALLERHALRAFDALHLATAMQVHTQLQATRKGALILLTADTKLLAAASAEGIQTESPVGGA
jgi:predicted nucleic acid-binding protein